jgi:hypothetical protein
MGVAAGVPNRMGGPGYGPFWPGGGRARLARLLKMRREATVVLYVALMVAIIVAVDFLFFRNRFWERLMVTIGIVLVFAAFYLSFPKRP